MVSARQLRQLLRISAPTLWRWERKGVIPPALRIRRRKYWPASVVDDLLRRAAEPGGIQSPPSSTSIDKQPTNRA